jgi:glyoxylase-like metal-dependent hydrolase (beta-lactamase superfamily II)/rhodanese-related sulfurtransferase
MLIRQFYLNCLAHASYLIGDDESKTAAVVDPQRDIDQYVATADEHGWQIKHVFLTHLHADFIAGHLELQARTGAAIHLGARAQAEYAFEPMADGDSVEFGQVRLTALETPGHTPESISILVFDLAKDARVPAAVLTGDTLFVGDVGRPDLRVALGWSAADLGRLLYDSLHDKLLALPDSTIVYPAHGAGSLCGKALGTETFSTIGDQRRLNYALQPMSKETFVELVTADQPDAPPYFTYDAVLNTKQRPTLDQALAEHLKPLSLEDVLALAAGGAQVLDARDGADFAAAHLTGSVNVGLVGQFATWAGTVLRRDRPIVIVADPGREGEAALRLGRIGFDHIAGYLKDGLVSLAGRPDLVERFDRLSAGVAAERLRSSEPPVLLDVRAPAETAAKAIAGSVNVPLTRLEAQIADVPAGRPVLVFCAGGYRSPIAASVLRRHGVKDVSELAGGMAAWEAAGLPVRTPAGSADSAVNAVPRPPADSAVR